MFIGTNTMMERFRRATEALSWVNHSAFYVLPYNSMVHINKSLPLYSSLLAGRLDAKTPPEFGLQIVFRSGVAWLLKVVPFDFRSGILGSYIWREIQLFSIPTL